MPGLASSTDKSTEDACMVHVPGTALLGSGHWVVMAGFTVCFQASGTKPNSEIKAFPSATPHSSVGRWSASGQAIASPAFLSLSTENIGTDVEMRRLVDVSAG